MRHSNTPIVSITYSNKLIAPVQIGQLLTELFKQISWSSMLFKHANSFNTLFKKKTAAHCDAVQNNVLYSDSDIS